MKCQLRVVFLVVSLVCGIAIASADDSFLQQPFKSYLFESKTYPDGVQELSRIIQKPVTLPDGVADFVKEINGWNIGFRIPDFMRIGCSSAIPTLRDVLDQTSSSLGMGWNYDQVKDRVVLDFSWHRDDPRTNNELLQVLLNASSVVSQPDLRYYWDHHSLAPNNLWQVAFDALLSKPENFRAVWKLRFADDMKRQCGYPQPVINLLSAKIKDQVGVEHVIILDDQPCPMNPGEGTMTYYVFDLNGKFEQGGIYNGGHRCHCASAWVEASATRVTVRTFFNYSGKMDMHFLLTKNSLVLHDVSDGQNQLSPSLWTGFHFGDSPFHVTN